MVLPHFCWVLTAHTAYSCVVCSRLHAGIVLIQVFANTNSPVDSKCQLTYTPLSTSNMLLWLCGMGCRQTTTAPFCSDHPVLKPALYFEGGSIHCLASLCFAPQAPFFVLFLFLANTSQDCLVSDTIASAGFVILLVVFWSLLGHASNTTAAIKC